MVLLQVLTLICRPNVMSFEFLSSYLPSNVQTIEQVAKIVSTRI